MKKGNPRILVVDDDESVVAMIRLTLEQALSAQVTTALECESARAELAGTDFDLVTLDYQMRDGNGLELLGEITAVEGHPPAIIVTGHGDEQTAAEAFKRGAAGYVVKDRRMTTLLVEEAERAMELKQALEALKESERQLKLITENMVDAIGRVDSEGHVTYSSPSQERALGFSRGELLGTMATDLLHPDDLERLSGQFREAIKKADPSVRLEYRYKRADGDYIWVESSTRLMYDDEGHYAGAIFGSRDVTDRRRAELLVRAQRDLASALGEVTEPSKVFEHAMRIILELTGLDSGGVHILNARTGALDLVCHTGLSEEFIGEVSHHEPDDYLVQVVREGEAVYRLYGEMERERTGARGREGLRILALVPLRYEGEVVGCLNVASHALEEFSPAMRDTIEALAGPLGQVVGRSRLASALKESEERYRRLYEDMGEATYTYDLELTMTGVNKRACEILGYDRDEMLGRNVLGLGILHPDDMESAAKDIQKLFSGDDIVRDEYRFILKDGSVRVGDVTGAVLRDSSGEIVGVTNVVIDITEEKLARQALLESREELRQSEERYRALFDQSPMGVIIFNDDLQVTECNERFIEMFETTRERMTGRELVDLGDRSVIPYLREALEGNVSHYEGRFSDTPSGMSIWISTEISPLMDARGRVVGGIGVIEDMSERKSAEDELRRANEELQGYAQTVSHDLRGPLAAIQIAAETYISVAKSGSGTEDLEEILDIIRHNSGRAYKRIEDLLILAKAGQSPVELEEIEVKAVVKDVLADLAGLVSETCATVNIDDDLGRLRANWTQVYQVFSNLISNALKHNDSERTTVDVRYGGTDETGAHRYTVRDNGPGIPEEDKKDIFKPFFKGDDTDGPGIGLSIAERMVKAYGGEITVSNEDGAVFEFTLNELSMTR